MTLPSQSARRRWDFVLIAALAIAAIVFALAGSDPAWPAAQLVMATVIARTR